MYIPRKMRNTSLLLIFSVCLITFQQTEALRRIKRGSVTTQNKTRLSSDLLSDLRNTSNDAHYGGHTLTALDKHEGMKNRNEHTWAKKAVAAVEHAIDQAFASLSHRSDVEKEKKVALHSTNNPKDSSIAGNDLHMNALSHMLAKRGLSARILDDMQRDVEFGGGEGPAEVLIIDNGFQPMMGMQHGINSYSLHQPNLRSVASSFKRLADLDKESKLNNPHSPKLTTYTSHINADGPMAVKHTGDNGISELNGNKEIAVVKNNKRADNNGVVSRDDYKTVDSHKRNNDHVMLTSEEHNGEAKHNGINNSNNHISSNNDELIGDKSHSTVSAVQQHNQQFQQQKLQEQSAENKDSFPELLSHSQKSVEGIGGESNKLHEDLQEQQQRKKHDSGKSVEVGGKRGLQPASSLTKPAQQQQVQVVKHSSGKMLPMESFLKFANMMLYKMGADGVPMHAQGAQLAVSGNPTTSVISIGPVMEGAEDLGTMDYLYNPFEPKMNFLRNPGSFAAAPALIGGSTNTALVSRPFLLPPYSLANSAQPINFIENALDLLLNAEEEGNDEMELVCPIHHPKKKSSDGDPNTNEKDGVIQVCSCRFFKKNKNA